MLTPIAPHTLTNRPLVLPATAGAHAPAADRPAREDIFVTFDGQTGYPLEAGDVVSVARAERPLRLVRSTERTYFERAPREAEVGER